MFCTNVGTPLLLSTQNVPVDRTFQMTMRLFQLPPPHLPRLKQKCEEYLTRGLVEGCSLAAEGHLSHWEIMEKQTMGNMPWHTQIHAGPYIQTNA